MTSFAYNNDPIPIVTIVACDSKNGIGSVTREFVEGDNDTGEGNSYTDLGHAGSYTTVSKIPWKGRLPEDSIFFKAVTSTVSKEGKLNACIIGRQSFLDIPPKFRKGFTNRIFVVITHHADAFKHPLTGENEGIEHLIAVSPDEGKEDQVLLKAIDTVKLSYSGRLECIFICGGESIYKLAAKQRLADSVLVTRIDGDFGCNRVFPEVDLSVYKKEERSSYPGPPLSQFEFNKELVSAKSQIKYSFEKFW